MQVCILSEGRCVFFGHPQTVVPWFSSIGYPFVHESGSVPDFAIDLVCPANRPLASTRRT